MGKFSGEIHIVLKMIFSSRVFFVQLLVFEIWSILCMVDFDVCDLMHAKDLKRFLRTSEARVLNPKACGDQGRSPGGRCGGRRCDQAIKKILTK